MNVKIEAIGFKVGDLLFIRKARRGTIILESADGPQFALTAVNNWEGFDVGSSNDFAHEVERTGKNKGLMNCQDRLGLLGN